MVSHVTTALRYAATHREQEDRLMIERGIGYWVSPTDELVPVPPRVSHADVMRMLIDPAALNEDDAEAFAVDPNAFALAQGWSRVRLYPGERTAYLDFGQGRQRTHHRVMQDLLDQLGLVDLKVKYTDEQGNYRSP